MDGLVLVFHGNREPEAAREAAAIADALGSRLAPMRVGYGFLQYAAPAVSEAVAALVGAGATRIDFLPLLVLTGNHAARGYPAVVEAARRAHPSVTFRALPYLAAHPRFPELVAGLVT
ncbi:MAG: hypothetical protein HY905_10085 [Deltaproteobacteria bacterium]|nr:hypothetical protein [Deltaproteobacteria bacterium]